MVISEGRTHVLNLFFDISVLFHAKKIEKRREKKTKSSISDLLRKRAGKRENISLQQRAI